MAYNMKRGNSAVPFREIGSSPPKQIQDQVPLSKHEEKKGTMITGGSKSEVINDLDDRIEFLNWYISDESSFMKKGKMITQRNKLRARLKAERLK